MFKYIKTAIRHYFLKRKLARQNIHFDLRSIQFQKKNVLIIDSVIPEYDKDSGSRRLLELIKLMRQNGVGVFLMADKKEYKYPTDYIRAFEELGVIVYQPSLDSQGRLITKTIFIDSIAPKLQFAWLHRPDVFEKYHAKIRKANHNCQLIFDMVDFHYLRFFREWEQSGNPKLKEEAESHLQVELQNCKNADHIIVISETDKASLKRHFAEDTKMKVIGNIHEFIEKDRSFQPFSERKNLLFVGGFKHLPNVDAVKFLHNDIMPLVWQRHPEISVVIVGSYPTEDILKLDSERFVIKGFVKEIESYYKETRLFIAPLRFGAGIKGKIGQSFEHSLPLVTTDVGAEGFDFSPFKEQMVASSAAELANKIIDLYTDESLWNRVSKHSETVIKPFSIAHIENQLKTLLELD